jgi:hypothetical protein
MPYLAQSELYPVADELQHLDAGSGLVSVPGVGAQIAVALESAHGDARTYRIEKTFTGVDAANRLIAEQIRIEEE